MTNDDTCQTTGKVVRRSRARALRDALEASARIGARLEPYLCPDCGTWHLRDRTKLNRKKRKKKMTVVVVVAQAVPEPAPVEARWGRPELHELLRRLGRQR